MLPKSIHPIRIYYAAHVHNVLALKYERPFHAHGLQLNNITVPGVCALIPVDNEFRVTNSYTGRF